MKKVAFLVFVIALMALPLVAQEQEKKDAEAVAQSWLALIDKADYGASWDEAASVFKSAIAKEKWAEAVGSSRGQFGAFSRGN